MKIIKKYIFILILSFMCVTESPAKLPDFRIALIDSTYFGNKNLKTKTPVLFIYFSPTCQECTTLIANILSIGDKLTQTQIVMITNEPLSLVRKFIDKHHLTKNIVVGTEGLTGRFIQDNPIEKLPFLAFYNKQGLFVKQQSDIMPIKDFLLECAKSQ